MVKPLIAVLITLVICVSAALPSPADDFAKANQAFESKKYAEAAQLYTGIVTQGMESAPLYFNLGNAHFKNGDLGLAVLYYTKAKRLDPGNEDIRNNLQFARQYTSVQMEGTQLNPVTSLLTTILDPYRLTTLAWASSFFFVLLFAILIVRYGFGLAHPSLRAATYVSLILLALFGSLTTFKYRHDFLTRRAVIVAQESPVHTGPTEQSELELHGAAGLTVEILSESGDYYNVLFENMRRGWIRKSLVAEI